MLKHIFNSYILKQNCLLFLSLFLLSCQSIPKGYHTINETYDTTGTEPCNNLMQKIKKEWAISDTCKCYYYNEKLVKKILKNKKCFIGMDTTTIIKTFGKPYFEKSMGLIYPISKKCDFNGYLGETYLHFNLDITSSKIENIELNIPSISICK